MSWVQVPARNKAYNLKTMARKDHDSLIKTNPEVMDGLPVIRGTRIPVYLILEVLESGMSLEQILIKYPHLKMDDIRAALRYARDLVVN